MVSVLVKVQILRLGSFISEVLGWWCWKFYFVLFIYETR